MNATTIDSKAKPPENLLYRSRIEICRILESLAKERSSVSAQIGRYSTFISRILFVNQSGENFSLSYCSDKSLNRTLLGLPSIKFSVNHQDAHLEFEVFNPNEMISDNQPVIQYDLPKELFSYRRRENSRIPISSLSSLRCIADESGIIPFEAKICDISHDGLGGMIYDRDIRLETGTVLKDCRIVLPNGKSVVTDLELRHKTMSNLPDGTLAYRAGFRFIQRPDEIADLINFFIQDLDNN